MLIDNVKVGSIFIGQEKRFLVKPGNHSICLQPGNLRKRAITFDITASQIVDFICGFSGSIWSGWEIYIQIDTGLATEINSKASTLSSSVSQVKVVQETNFTSNVEVYGDEEFPIDNRYGNEILTIEHEVSKTATNEISIVTNLEGTIGLSGGIASIIQAEIAANRN